MKFLILPYFMLLAACSADLQPDPSPRLPESSSSSSSSSFRPTEAQLAELKAQLNKQKAVYDTKIKTKLSDHYSGFNSRYNMSENEGSFLARIALEEVQLFSELADLIYVNKFKDIGEIEAGLLERLSHEKYKNYRIVGAVRRNLRTELSAIMLYNKDKNHFIIVFRGSVSAVDWINNFKFLKFVANNDHERKHQEALKTLDGSSLNIHGGFARIYLEGIEQFDEQFQTLLHSHFSEIKESSLTFRLTTVGHSLGGALALIKANNLSRTLLDSGLFVDPSEFSIETISFGAPRVYDASSSKKVEENLRGAHNIIRIVHEADPVPNLPTLHLGGGEIGTPIYLPAKLGSGKIKNLMRHMMGNYIRVSSQVFKQIKEETLLAQRTKNEITRLKKTLGDTSPNSFDKVDMLQRLNYLLIDKRAQQVFLKKVRELSISDPVETEKKYRALSKAINEIENQIKALK